MQRRHPRVLRDPTRALSRLGDAVRVTHPRLPVDGGFFEDRLIVKMEHSDKVTK